MPRIAVITALIPRIPGAGVSSCPTKSGYEPCVTEKRLRQSTQGLDRLRTAARSFGAIKPSATESREAAQPCLLLGRRLNVTNLERHLHQLTVLRVQH